MEEADAQNLNPPMSWDAFHRNVSESGIGCPYDEAEIFVLYQKYLREHKALVRWQKENPLMAGMVRRETEKALAGYADWFGQLPFKTFSVDTDEAR